MTNPLKGMNEEQVRAWMDQPPTRQEIYSIITKMVRADVLVTSALSQIMSDDMDAAISILKSALHILDSASDLLPLADPHILIAMGLEPAEGE